MSANTVPASAPRYLYRGECGLYPETECGHVRFCKSTALNSQEMDVFQNIVTNLRQVFTHDDYGISEEESEGLLEHYEIPTSVINFSSSLEVATAFAAAGGSSHGRICILTKPYHGAAHTWDFRKHPWAERASRQEAFAVRPIGFSDLKSRDADLYLGALWVEFEILPVERDVAKRLYRSLLHTPSDPYAAILRGEINHYVERFGKIPHRTAEFLVKRIPMVPLIHIVSGIDEEHREVITHHVNPSVYPFSEADERERTLRYWSEDCQEPSDFLDSLYPFEPPREPGKIFAFPGTHHGSAPPLQDVEAASERLAKLLP